MPWGYREPTLRGLQMSPTLAYEWFLRTQVHPMLLVWDFEWGNNRASATAKHGTYTVARLITGEWAASFTRVDTEKFRRTRRSVGLKSATFMSVADAIRACRSHAERYSADTSSRLMVITPRPQ